MLRCLLVGQALDLAPCDPGDTSMQSRNGRPSRPGDTAGGAAVRGQPSDGELTSDNAPQPPGPASPPRPSPEPGNPGPPPLSQRPPAEPSWGAVLVTTVRLWLRRRLSWTRRSRPGRARWLVLIVAGLVAAVLLAVAATV